MRRCRINSRYYSKKRFARQSETKKPLPDPGEAASNAEVIRV